MKVENSPLTVALLAGGKSSRMGKDKAFLKFNEKTFIEIIYEELKNFDEILLSVKKENLEKYAFLPVKKIFDEKVDAGPLEGIKTSLMESKNELVFISACDMPFIKKELPLYLLDFYSSDYDAYVPVLKERTEPLCAVYKKSILPVVEKHLQKEDYKLSRLLDDIKVKYIPMEKSSLSEKIFSNINTEEDYEKLNGPCIFSVSGFKKSGKTSLILSLQNELSLRGYTFSVIKHDGHDCFTDAEGTDTFRFSQAGALSACIFSDRRYAFFASEKVTVDTLIEKTKNLSTPPDFIIIEGMKNAPFPKVEVLRTAVSCQSCCKKEEHICFVSDFAFSSEDNIPSFDFSDVKKITDTILNYFYKGLEK